ncbi:MAG: NusA-like transcription termination signal-binding factor [Nanoarchaeota archaeon]|nr:NusA-like transcription termination signal-binding factor [Nanoarchaeota archaeon]MBU1005879.1 NusA-like transcription termination signal-binding factor [Nanoarchaeota archaeon]MBU1946025.1 NusA-like transcription termination signal-binding factor [Nanoarchaeota archaeon]
MSRIKYDINLMNYIKLFENLTRAKVKDCISNDHLIFIVEENEIGKAIGKGGSNIRRLEDLLKKKIKVAEFSPDVRQFIRNFVMPLHVNEISDENNIITISGPDTKTKGLLIGRDRKNINYLKEVVGRYFKVEDIKVI